MTLSIPELPLLNLSDDELALIQVLRQDMLSDRWRLQLRDAYFNGEQLVRDLGISIPPQLKGLHTVIGWPRIGVESLEERLDLEALRWADGSDSSDLQEIVDANDLLDESSLAHLDALTYGREYLAVGSGDCGTDDCPPLISIESPLDMTLMWDARLRMGTAALRECAAGDLYDAGGDDRMLVLYLPDQTIHAVPTTSGGWEVVDRDVHQLGVVPVVRMANRQRTADRVGKSEITPDVMSITDAACRRLMGIEVASEFFGAPQRYILGASESAFQDAEGNAKSAWETYIGRVLALERDEDGNVPTVGQFSAHDPSGQTKIIDLYARIMASQFGLPPHMLGYTTDNPASADAIRSTEAKLVKRAERRSRRFGAAWQQAMRLALWVRDGEPPDKSRRIECVWRNPATPTIAAQTDAVVKLVQANILPADSDVALEMAGLTEGQRQRVAADRRRSTAGAGLLDRLAQLDASPVSSGAPDVAPEVPSAGDDF
ncbi:phage portal protein [Streptomyces nigrescens]|uniref:Phage portal protein n=1 Tax=Streptomyces nigrescens TaxID=1920 RepID=A0A640TEF2_STRNI|nr:phage portal protein [Streptomyces libani]WAT94879.1 phage portal protein [Streptomyces libani subsp. libani]GFE20025.1 putative structural protein - phage associated [Streptomyces libani subsp. libani]GGV85599.1 putative structural protein - phage associated [Streptomyces libani subsp. libani]